MKKEGVAPIYSRGESKTEGKRGRSLGGGLLHERKKRETNNEKRKKGEGFQ